jgi:hypothetical protein
MDRKNRFPAEGMTKLVAQSCPEHLDKLEDTQLLIAFERDPADGKLYFRMAPYFVETATAEPEEPPRKKSKRKAPAKAG